jgi:uncharacterized protein YdaU (DUF1376 family)
MNKPPAFQFYPQDYLSSARVAEMTLEEEGVYIRLLCYCWSSGSIPADPQRCARLAGKGCSIEVATIVQRSFNEDPTDGDRLVHDRLDIERNKQNERREQASMAGKKSGKLRAEKANQNKTPAKTDETNDRSTTVQLNGNTSSSSSSSSSTSETIYTPGSDVRIPDSINDPNVKAAVGLWLDYLDRKYPEKSIEINSPEEEALYRTIQTWGVSVGQICVRIDECISNSWANLRRPEGKSSTTATASIWPAIVAHLGRIDPYKDYSEGIAAKFGNKALAAVKSIGVPNINQANEYQASVLAKRFRELMNADV